MSAGASKNIAIRCKSVKIVQTDEDDAPKYEE
jgi:hypothetical protein